jgi:pimeloyl-ACP methyl ester carboxylesterase
MSLIDIPGAHLNVVDVGQGPPILFAHGFPLDHAMWRFQIDELSHSGFRCIAPDLRGFGHSSVSEGIITMEQFADDLAELLDAMSIQDEVVFCGLSMGGYIAWQFERRHAQRLKALILCDTRAVADTAEAAANRRKLAEDVLQHGSAIVANAMLPRLFAASTIAKQPEIIEETRQVILSTSPRGIAAGSLALCGRLDARPWLASITVPTLLLAGEHDVISTPLEMRQIAEAMPHARFEVIPDAGHLAPLENPQVVNRVVRQFLEHQSKAAKPQPNDERPNDERSPNDE